jgi:hypothetical protein
LWSAARLSPAPTALFIAVASPESWQVARGGSAIVATEAGKGHLSYGALRVTDATGRLLSSHFSALLGGARIIVDTQSATYPVVASPAGAGYLLVGSDGGVFAFGNTHFYGSLPGLGIRVSNVRGALLSSLATGYALVGSDGGAFIFGSGVNFHGSLPGENIRVNNVVGLALAPDDGGYSMAGSDGKVDGFGNAKVQPDAHWPPFQPARGRYCRCMTRRLFSGAIQKPPHSSNRSVPYIKRAGN